MKILRFILVIVLILSLTGCAGSRKTGKEPKKKPESAESSGSPDGNPGVPSDENPEGLDWTIQVDDTVSGSYKVPMSEKSLQCDITLRLVAWKSGGADVYGKYEGEAYILLKFDESGLSDTDLLYMGGGSFNRMCGNLEFEVEVYDQEKRNRKVFSIPGSEDIVSVVPLRKFNAMAFSISSWSTILQMDQTVKDKDSGNTLSEITGESGEGESSNMGLDLFIDNGYVMIDIPTYRLTWDCGYFDGTVVSSPVGTVKRDKLDVPDVGLVYSDEDEGQGEEYPAQTESYEGLMMDPYLKDKYIEKDSNGLSGYDMNGDGKVDMYIDDAGEFKIDINFDGVFDDMDNTDVEWGQG